MELYGFNGLERIRIDSASAGDIVMLSGIDDLRISDTVCARSAPEGLPPLRVDEPTINMTFQVNKSPFAGREGKFLTSRQIQARLDQELKHNVALRVEATADPDKFRVSGRGELHLSVLIETMRREGYEFQVSRPEVITRQIDGAIHEPVEHLLIDTSEEFVGTVRRFGPWGRAQIEFALAVLAHESTPAQMRAEGLGIDAASRARLKGLVGESEERDRAERAQVEGGLFGGDR